MYMYIVMIVYVPIHKAAPIHRCIHVQCTCNVGPVKLQSHICTHASVQMYVCLKLQYCMVFKRWFVVSSTNSK